MERRSFIGIMVGFIAWLFGSCIGRAAESKPDKSTETPASFRWLKEQLAGQHWQLVNPPLKRCWKPEEVRFSHVDCGAETCPCEQLDGEFRARIYTKKHTYGIVAKVGYLGCISSNPDLTAFTDLADGKRTVETWHRIVEDIMRMETTGSKYKN